MGKNGKYLRWGTYRERKKSLRKSLFTSVRPESDHVTDKSIKDTNSNLTKDEVSTEISNIKNILKTFVAEKIVNESK